MLNYASSLTSHTAWGKNNEIVAKMTTRLAALGVLTKAGRVVVLLRDADFDQLNSTSFLEALPRSGHTVGIAIDGKIVLMRQYSGWDTAFHEVLHTLPYVWSTDEMSSECDRDYHNFADDGVANGVRLYSKGKLVARTVITHKTAILGRGDEGFYIAQCTYAHLVHQLTLKNDPATLFVRAIVRQNGTASFEPLYTQDGYLDVPAKSGTWAIVVRDARGRQLQRAPFTPNWDVHSLKSHRNAESVFFRFPLSASAARVEVRGPRGVAAQVKLSSAPPSLSVTGPSAARAIAPAALRVHVTWRAATSNGAAPLASVLYSTDGKLYELQSFEKAGSSFDVRLASHAKQHHIKIIVSDGTRSSEREIVLKPSGR